MRYVAVLICTIPFPTKGQPHPRASTAILQWSPARNGVGKRPGNRTKKPQGLHEPQRHLTPAPNGHCRHPSLCVSSTSTKGHAKRHCPISPPLSSSTPILPDSFPSSLRRHFKCSQRIRNGRPQSPSVSFLIAMPLTAQELLRWQNLSLSGR